MADHTEFVELAVELIEAEGRDIHLVVLSGTAVDHNKPWNGPGQPTPSATYPVKAVFLPASGGDLSSVVSSPELLATVEQVALVAPHPTADLAACNIMLDSGSSWKVSFVQVLKPADQVCLYVFGVKR